MPILGAGSCESRREPAPSSPWLCTEAAWYIVSLHFSRCALGIATFGREGGADMNSALHHRNANLSKSTVKSGFRFLATGACTMNENDIHKYGSTLAASATIMAVGGNDGSADVQCIASSCEYTPSLLYSWRAVNSGRRALSFKGGKSFGTASPSCERGTWVPPTGGRVEVAISENSVIFGGAGCVEMHKMQEDQSWAKVTSFPTTLDVMATGRDGAPRSVGTLLPSRFASKVAMDVSTVLVAGAIDAADQPPVVVIFARLGAKWEQADALECPASAPCKCEEGAERDCFGFALAVHDDMVAVGFPRNQSVLLYQRRIVPLSESAGRGEERDLGAGGMRLRWDLIKVLTADWEIGGGSTLFGSSLALGDSLLVVGFPSAGNSGARLYSMLRNDSAAFPLGAKVLDTRTRCCEIGLPCCNTAFVGASVDIAETEHVDFPTFASVAVGDPRTAQVHMVTCETRKLLSAPSGEEPCTLAASILPGYSRRWDSNGADGFGARTALGGQAILVADSSDECAAVDIDQGCGTVCEVAACSPGHCLSYDFSTDSDFCERCSHPEQCPGGVMGCAEGREDSLFAMAMSTLFFSILFCALYSMSAASRGGTFLEIAAEVLSCGLLRYVPGRGLRIYRESDEALMGAGDAEEEDSDDEREGYVPPSVRAVFRPQPEATATAPTSCAEGGGGSEEEGSGSGGETEENDVEAGLGSSDAPAERAGSTAREEAGESGHDGQEEIGVEGSGSAAEAGARDDGAENGGEEALDGPPGEVKVGVSVSYFSCKVCFERRIQTVAARPAPPRVHSVASDLMLCAVALAGSGSLRA